MAIAAAAGAFHSQPSPGGVPREGGAAPQVGGMMRSEALFRRVIVRYAITGHIEAISHETWRPIEPN